MDSWFGDSINRFRKAGNREGLRMVMLLTDSYGFRESNPDHVLHLIREARQVAESMGDPWWKLYTESQYVHALLHFKRDFRTVLDLAVKCSLDVRKPQFAQYPERFGVFDNLVAAYLGIDAIGYAEPIQQALDYLETEIPRPHNSTRYLMLARKRIFACEKGDLEEMYSSAMRELNYADGDSDQDQATHFSVFAYCGLCLVAEKRGDWKTMDEYAENGGELAEQKGHHCELAELLMWRAVAARKMGEEEQAKRYARRAVSSVSRIQMPPKEPYFDALAMFYELEQAPLRSLRVRERELELLKDRGRFLYEYRVRLKRCRLLASMGQITSAEIEATKAAALRLRKPEEPLREIGALIT